MNSKYGQIARIKKELVYNIDTYEDDFYDDCVWFDIYITKKTSKSRNFKQEYVRQYHLDDGKNLDVLKKIIENIKEYLETYKPRYIALTAFEEDNWIKRMNFYLKTLSRFGYSAFDHYNRDDYPGTLVLTYTEDCKKIYIGAGFDQEYEDFYFYTKNGEKSFINWR